MRALTLKGGARPQFVKAAIVSLALEKYPDVEHAFVKS